MKNPVGRPKNPHALTKRPNGRPYMLWFSKIQMDFLDEEAKRLGISKSAIIRSCVEEYIMAKE